MLCYFLAGAKINSCMIGYLSRRLHLSIETFEERMLQAHYRVIEELHFLGYAVQNASDQQKQQGHSLRRVPEDTTLICQDVDPVDGLKHASSDLVRKDSDQDYERLQHNVECTTTLYHKSGGATFGEPLNSGPLDLIADQHRNQVQLPGSTERKLCHRKTEKMLQPATGSSFRRFHTFPFHQITLSRAIQTYHQANHRSR